MTNANPIGSVSTSPAGGFSQPRGSGSAPLMSRASGRSGAAQTATSGKLK